MKIIAVVIVSILLSVILTSLVVGIVHYDKVIEFFKTRKALRQAGNLREMRKLQLEEQLKSAVKAEKDLKREILMAHGCLKNSGRYITKNSRTADWFSERGYKVESYIVHKAYEPSYRIEIPPISDKEYSDLILGDGK